MPAHTMPLKAFQGGFLKEHPELNMDQRKLGFQVNEQRGEQEVQVLFISCSKNV